MLLAERIRANIATINTIRGRDISVTVSIGAASLSDGDTAGSLFERADAALYAAKDAGRNRCERG
jgi:diguanylate cyclase